ncbi:hypothetical protein ACTFIW_002555 [Dictyostelium discoideum]
MIIVINQKYLIKKILNYYLSFYSKYGDEENGILFLSYSIMKLSSICKDWKRDLVRKLTYPRIEITNMEVLAYVVEWIEKLKLPINNLKFPFHQQKTMFKDDFLSPQLTESVPIIVDRIRSISFRSGKIDYGGTILLTDSIESASFGVFNNKEYQKFCNILVNYKEVIKKSLTSLTLTTILYENDIDIQDIKESIKSLQVLDSLILVSCFQNQIQSLDLIPQLSKTLRKIKLLYINIEYEMLLNMIKLIIENQQKYNNIGGGNGDDEICNISYFELNAKFLNHHLLNNNNSGSKINNNNNSNQLPDNGVLWEDEEEKFNQQFSESSNRFYLDGVFELLSNWKSLKSFKIIMPDETVNVSSVLNFLGCQENLKKFTFIVKLNDDINKNNNNNNNNNNEYITSIDSLNYSVKKIMIKSFIENDKDCIPMIWNKCKELNRLKLHLEGDTIESDKFYSFNDNDDNNKSDLEIEIFSLNHPYSNRLFNSIHSNLNVVSVTIINEKDELDSLREVLLWNHPTIKTLNFNKSDCKSPQTLSLIDPIVNNNTIEFLYISGVLQKDSLHPQHDNLELLIQILSRNNTLIHLDFSFNSLPTKMTDDELSKLLNAIQSNKTIQSLTLNGCWDISSKYINIINKTLLTCGILSTYCGPF